MHLPLESMAASLPLLLGAGSSDASDLAAAFTLGNMWAHMGWVAKGVALTLGIMSLLSLGIFIERLLAYRKAFAQSQLFAEAITEHLAANRLKEAGETAEGADVQQSHVARVCSAGIREFLGGRNGGNDVVESARKAIERTIQLELLELRRGLGALATIANTAPFVGLFGTVFGIIKSFQDMGEGGGITKIAGGISEALITTAFGLFVAVPAVWFFNYFSNRVETFSVDMNNSMLELLDYFEKDRGRGTAAAATGVAHGGRS